MLSEPVQKLEKWECDPNVYLFIATGTCLGFIIRESFDDRHLILHSLEELPEGTKAPRCQDRKLQID